VSYINIVACISDLYMGFGLVNRFIGYSQFVTTINYNTKDYSRNSACCVNLH
jgi:hypothetical protein